MAKKETILVFGAHNDDQVLGVGGTMAKYAKEGKRVITVIFSYGELSHPHLKPELLIKWRVKESRKPDEIMGGKGVYYLGIMEGKFMEEAGTKKTKEKIKGFIKKYKPAKIFTHSMDDPHPAHREVLRVMKEAFDEIDYKGDVYVFKVWNPFTIRKRGLPKMVVDITNTFKNKVEAIKAHTSQKMTVISLMWNVYLQAKISGMKEGVKYAEVFYKIR